MPHIYECPMRWADMDLLGHINNVAYLEYVAEAREAFLAGLSVSPGQVVLHQVEFTAPLVYRRRPVLVDSWVTEVAEDRVALAHEVYDAPTGDATERTVYVRVSTEMAVRLSTDQRERLEGLRAPGHRWRSLADEPRPGGHSQELTVRHGDVDRQGKVRDVEFFEYFQEARIQLVMNLHTRGQEWSHHVVARTDIAYVEPVSHRVEPYVLRSWVGHVGTKSFTVLTEMLDGDRPVATAAVVMVAFDKETQRPVDMAESQRERLLLELG